jgi:TPR repeat protein
MDLDFDGAMRKLLFLIALVQVPILVSANTCGDMDRQNKYSALDRGDRLAAMGARNEALKCYQTACDLGHEKTCESLADYKATKNFQRAFGIEAPSGETALVKRCMLDQRTTECKKLIEGSADLELKKNIYRSNCENHRPGSCFQLAAIYFKSGDLMRAEHYYLESCNLGETTGCSMGANTGQMLNGERLNEQNRIAEKQIEEDQKRERYRRWEDLFRSIDARNKAKVSLKCTSVKDLSGMLRTTCIQ